MIYIISHFLKFLKDVSTLTSYTPLDAPTLNPNISFIGLPSLFLLNKKVRNQYGKCRIIGSVVGESPPGE
jgi:hypothetical protein